jgi:hypothetical protein
MRFEIGGVKMKKNGGKKKKHVKTFFLYCSFLVGPWALHFKDDL